MTHRTPEALGRGDDLYLAPCLTGRPSAWTAWGLAIAESAGSLSVRVARAGLECSA